MKTTLNATRITRQTRQIVPALAALVLTTGCATVQPIAEDAWKGTKKVANAAADGVSKTFQKLAGYLKRQDELKRNHDTGNHDEKQVERLVRKGKRTRKPGQAPTVPAGKYLWPVEAGIISSEYGPRWGREHRGIDIAADTGEPILAAADGVVEYADSKLRGYGNVVILRHANDVTTLYAHNSALKVKAGQRVKQGDVIALLGSTGHSTGPHCHFEIRGEDGTLNPRLALVKTPIFPDRAGTRTAGLLPWIAVETAAGYVPVTVGIDG